MRHDSATPMILPDDISPATIFADWWPDNPSRLAPLYNGTAISGNFDGLHYGHQALIRQGLAAGPPPHYLLSFEPHPRMFFTPEKPVRLNSLAQKAALLPELGVEAIAILPFGQALSECSAENFIDSILCDYLKLSHLVVGHDFCFGHERSGDITLLKAKAEARKFGLTCLAPVYDEGGVIYSSTQMRQALKEGRPQDVQKITGRFFAMEALVEKGDQRGRAWGFPTANLDPGDFFRPRYGVYRIGAKINTEFERAGIAYLGVRPTVAQKKLWLEVHLFDFQDDIYGQKMTVTFYDFLRPEQKFDSEEVLRQQIALDIERAQKMTTGEKVGQRP